MSDEKCPKCKSECHVRDIRVAGIVDHVVDGERCKRRQIIFLRTENVRLQATVDKLVAAIMADDNWQDDWCVICHGHPGHDNTHGGNDCPMIELATNTRKDVTR